MHEGTHKNGEGFWSACKGFVIVCCVIAALRVVYLVWLCPYTLVEDEAQYWVWSRHLDWAYSTKGPGVAWTIRAFTSVFGHGEWAIRLPSVIASLIATIAMAGVAWDMTRSRASAIAAGVLWMVAPAAIATSLMMTIDPPYMACWIVACWLAWRGLAMQRPSALAWCGMVIGIGLLYKYTILILPVGFVLFAIVWKHGLTFTRRHALFAMFGVLLMVLALVPVVMWNRAHDWTSVRHLLGHMGMKGGDIPVAEDSPGYSPLWTLTLIGTQFGLIAGGLVLGVAQAIRAIARRGAGWMGESFLLACAAPIVIMYLGVSFVAEPEGNWPLAGSMTLVVLGGLRVGGAMSGVDRVAGWMRRTRIVYLVSIVCGLFIAAGMLRLDLLARVPGLSIIPAGRFTDADRMGEHAGRLLDELRARTGKEPFIVANHYGRAAQLWYYMPGRPRVYCSSGQMPGGRKTPWDYWPGMRFDDAPDLLGRPGVAVGLTSGHWRQVFARVQRLGTLEGDHKKSRPAFLCEDFAGVPPGGVREAEVLP